MISPLPPAPDAPILFTVTEAVEKLRIRRDEFWRLVKRGSIRVHRISPRKVLVPRGSLEEWAR